MRKKLKILMVEDSAEDAELIQYALKGSGFNFTAKLVNKKADFIKSIDEINPNIILSDFSMPGFDGLSALKIARRRAPNVPFVFVSGTIGEERAIEAVKNGATDYILKDNLTTLAPKIKRALKEAKLKIDRLNAKRDLEKRTRQLSEAQSVAQIGCWEVDIDTKKIYWSDEIYKIMGFAPDSITPNIELFLSGTVGEENKKVASIWQESFQNFTDFAFYTQIKRNDNNAKRWIYVNAKYKLNKNGKADTIFGTLQDVTNLKETEIKLKQTNDELKSFVYKASHDLRGPISSALGLCNLAKEDCHDPKQNEEYIVRINDRILQLDTAISSLIETIKIKDENLQPTTINFNEIVSEILQQFQYVKGASSISYTIDIEDFKFFSYHSILYSILQNLIDNAIKYQSSNQPEVKIKIKKRNGMVKIEVSDNGPGIPDNIKERIFEMFFRGNNKSKGTGLGLYIVKNAVERLKGTIEVDSAYGKGSSFKLSIPVLGVSF